MDCKNRGYVSENEWKLLEGLAQSENFRHQSGRIEPCGSRVLFTSGEFVEVLNFRHFARHMSFTPTGKQGKKKQIMNGIEVSVVLHLV